MRYITRMLWFWRLHSVAALMLCIDSASWGQTRFSKDQQLVIAAFELDVAKVKTLLADGANPNARLGLYDEHLFEDKWMLGYSPIGSNNWTPLLAAANSHCEPEPKNRTENTSKGLEAARKKLNAIDPKLIRERDRRRAEIVKLLIAAKADLDLDDGYGATALTSAVGCEEVALLLIAAGAEINTKQGVYIDGPGDITPVHEAARHPKVLEAMLKRRANVRVHDSTGDTPLHWAARDLNVASVKLLLAAGADPKVKDNKGRTPAYWCEPYHGLTTPDERVRRQITKLLSEASAFQKTPGESNRRMQREPAK